MKMLIKISLLYSLCVLACPAWLRASEPEDKSEKSMSENDKRDNDLDDSTEIVITAKRKSDIEQSVISSDEINREQFSKTAEGRLQHLAGVDLTRKSVSGNDRGKVLLRGLDESRILVLFDGHSLNGAGVYGGYFVDWSSLSVEDVERIDIYRGAASVKYGNTLGGVVNIVTKEGSKTPRTTIRVSGGSLDSWDAQLSHSWGFGPLRYNLSLGHNETDGDLRNSYLKRNTISGKVTLLLPFELHLSTSARYSTNNCGMTVYNKPDSPYYDSSKPESLESSLGGPYVKFINHGYGRWGSLDWGYGSHWDDGRSQFDLTLSRKVAGLDVSATAYLIEQKRTEYFFAIDDPRHLVLKRELEPEKHNWGWRTDLKKTFDGYGAHTLEAGAEGTYLGYGGVTVMEQDESYFPPSANQTIPQPASKISMLHGIYLQDQWHVSDWLDLDAGLRFDNFVADAPEENAPHMNDSTFTPRAEVSISPWDGGHVAMRYRWSHRFPNLPEYFWWYSGYQPEDRKSLRPESAHMFELEAGHEIGKKFSVTVRAYHYMVNDYIRWIFGYRPSRVIYNIDSVDFSGFEAEAAYSLPYHLEVWANYTWQMAKKSGDVLDNSSQLTDELTELPRNKLNMGIAYKEKDGLEARFTARYVDLRKVVVGDLTTPGASHLENLEPFVQLDIFASYPLLHYSDGKELRVELAIQNLLNQHYVEEYGFPMPGLVFMAGMRASL